MQIQSKKGYFIILPVGDRKLASKRYSHPGPRKQ